MGNRRQSEVVVIEAYAFLAMFTVQILVGSVLSPARVIAYIRGWARDFGSERFAQLYPGVDYSKSVEVFVTRYRAVSIVITVTGVLLLGWLFTLIQHPGWTGEVSKPTVMYFLLQMSPLPLVALYAFVRYGKALMQPSQETKRKATLQRRGLFDFVSPFVVYLAVLTYFLFVLFSIYLDLWVYQNTTLSKFCYIAIGSVTMVYALNAFIIYKSLYGRKNPLVRNEGRVHTIGVRVKGGVYTSMATAWFISLMGTFTHLDLERWRPFALSAFLVITSLLGFMDWSAPRHKPEADELGSSSELPS